MGFPQRLTGIYLPVINIMNNTSIVDINWRPATERPAGFERRVLLWVVWPEDEILWPVPPEAIIGWWKHGPQCFGFDNVEHADHLVTHWCEIPEP